MGVTKSPALLKIEKAYKENSCRLFRARIGNKNHKLYAKREKRLECRYIILAQDEGCYIYNPCKLSKNIGHNTHCRDCSGYYERKVIVEKNGKKHHLVVEVPRLMGDRCKAK